MECTIGSLPSLTFQYMSDSGTVELSRDCGEEGTRHVQCHGQRGVEREHILGQLRCADESSSPASSMTVVPTAASIFDTTVDRRPYDAPLTTAEPSAAAPHSNGVTAAAVAANTEPSSARTEVLTFVHSNANEEDNSIAIDVSSLSRVHELMQSDGPTADGHIEKPQKPTGMKKVLAKDRMEKKPYSGKPAKLTTRATQSPVGSEELMMSDQPVDTDAALAAALQPLPHVKKTLKSNLHTRPTTPAPTTRAVTTIASVVTDAAMITAATTSRERRETIEPLPVTTGEVATATTPTPADAETTTASWKPTSNASGHESHNASLNVDTSVDHFIPPLLMVRTQFTSTMSPTATTTIAPVASSSIDVEMSEYTTTAVVTEADVAAGAAEVVESTTMGADVEEQTSVSNSHLYKRTIIIVMCLF